MQLSDRVFKESIVMLKNTSINKDGDLVLTLSLNKKCVTSKSGKSLVLSTTGGNQGVSIKDLGMVKIGVNVYKAA